MQLFVNIFLKNTLRAIMILVSWSNTTGGLT